jgi:hypothetical protein
MPDLSNYTNGQLLEIIADPEREEWQSAFDKLEQRMDEVNYKAYKGFETPTNPPPTP